MEPWSTSSWIKPRTAVQMIGTRQLRWHCALSDEAGKVEAQGRMFKQQRALLGFAETEGIERSRRYLDGHSEEERGLSVFKVSVMSVLHVQVPRRSKWLFTIPSSGPSKNDHQDDVCRQAMVFPNPQRPTGSGTTWNIAPGRHTEFTKNYKVRATFALRSVDRMSSIAVCEVPMYRRTVQQSTDSARRRARTAGHRSVDWKREE